MDEDTVWANDQAAIQDGFDTMLSQLSFNDHSEGEEEKQIVSVPAEELNHFNYLLRKDETDNQYGSARQGFENARIQTQTLATGGDSQNSVLLVDALRQELLHKTQFISELQTTSSLLERQLNQKQSLQQLYENKLEEQVKQQALEIKAQFQKELDSQVELLRQEAESITKQKVASLDADFQKRTEQVREECLLEMRSEREIQMQRCAKERIERELRTELSKSLRKEISLTLNAELTQKIQAECQEQMRRELESQKRKQELQWQKTYAKLVLEHQQNFDKLVKEKVDELVNAKEKEIGRKYKQSYQNERLKLEQELQASFDKNHAELNAELQTKISELARLKSLEQLRLRKFNQFKTNQLRELSLEKQKVKEELMMKDRKERHKQIRKIESIERHLSKKPGYTSGSDDFYQKYTLAGLASSDNEGVKEPTSNRGILSQDQGTLTLIQKLDQQKEQIDSQISFSPSDQEQNAECKQLTNYIKLDASQGLSEQLMLTLDFKTQEIQEERSEDTIFVTQKTDKENKQSNYLTVLDKMMNKRYKNDPVLTQKIKTQIQKDEASRTVFETTSAELIEKIEAKFKSETRSHHGMLDYLTELWQKLSLSYSERLSTLNKLVSQSDIDDVYAMLTFETTLLAGLLCETHQLIAKKEQKFGNLSEKRYTQSINSTELQSLRAKICQGLTKYETKHSQGLMWRGVEYADVMMAEKLQMKFK